MPRVTVFKIIAFLFLFFPNTKTCNSAKNKICVLVFCPVFLDLTDVTWLGKSILSLCPIYFNCAHWNYMYYFFWGGGCWCDVVGFHLLQWCDAEGKCCADQLATCALLWTTQSPFLAHARGGRGSRIWSQEIYGYWLHCAEAMGTAIKYSYPSLEVVCWIICYCNETVSARNDVCMRHRTGMFRERVAYKKNFSLAKVEGCLGLRSVWRGSSTSVPRCNHRKEFHIIVNTTL